MEAGWSVPLISNVSGWDVAADQCRMFSPQVIPSAPKSSSFVRVHTGFADLIF